MASTKLQNELISMGPKEAQESLGMSLEDYITIAYDNDIIDYVSDHIPELTNLTRSGPQSYDYNGEGPMRGQVFHFVGKHTNKKGNLVLPYVAIPQMKLTYLIASEKQLTPGMLMKFVNEFYKKNVTRIVKIPKTNFG